MSPSFKSFDPKDLVYGGLLQSAEAMSFGMPFEVWKTHMGTYRSQTTIGIICVYDIYIYIYMCICIYVYRYMCISEAFKIIYSKDGHIVNRFISYIYIYI
jgi:hypothetical protein